MLDGYYILNWWVIFFIIGAAGLPLCTIIFNKFLDSGYGLSKTLSLLFVSYGIFLLSTFRLLPFTRISLFLILAVYLGINLKIYFKNKEKIKDKIRNSLPIIIVEEVLFLLGLLLWSYVRAHNPDINGLEKFMDYGFINSILESQYLPPIDMWFAGKSINYYWFGHLISAVATKLADTPSAISYNLMLATILGLGLSGSFSIVASLTYSVHKVKRIAVVAGITSAILLNFAGNFHTPYYVYKLGTEKYWYPDATRFIGYNPETNDKTIHEFPIYSYVVSDLHAHLINFPFVLLFLALLYNFIKREEKEEAIKFLRLGSFKFEITKSDFLRLTALGAILGMMFMANAWDFANYMLVFGIAILIWNLKKYGIKFDTVYKTAVFVLIVIATAILVVIPFIINFESIAEGVQLTTTKTPLWQLAVLWGFPGVLTIVFSLIAFIKRKNIRVEDLFVIALLISSWALIFIPEFIFVKDIYIASHYRANTMFKLTYQAYVMTYLTSGYIAIRTIRAFDKLPGKLLSLLFFGVLFSSIMYYPKIAVKSYYGDLETKRGLNGEIWLRDSKPDMYQAVLWFRENVSGQPVILEAPGDSYTEYNVISSYTGLPTVSGWFVHEWLWRGSPEEPQERVNDITQIYTSADALSTKTLLQKYQVEYVIVGTLETEKFPDLNEAKFGSLGREVFTSSTTKVYKIN